MQILEAEQGSDEWLAARLGRPSASQFHKLITSTGKPSASADSYINTMIAERLLGKSEPFFVTDNEVQEVGFILDNSGEFGCSPDGLVGEDGGIEIKCPAPHNHVAWSRKKVCPSKHYAQVQGCMWITGRDWWDFMSYHPEMNPFIVRVERDEEFIDKLAKEVLLAVTEIISEVRNLK